MMANVVAAWTGNNVVDAVTRVVDELALPGSLRGDYPKSNRTKTTTLMKTASSGFWR